MCTDTEKEDSWLSDEPESSPGVPIDETTDSEQTVAEIEEQEEQDAEDQEDESTEKETEAEDEQSATIKNFTGCMLSGGITPATSGKYLTAKKKPESG